MEAITLPDDIVPMQESVAAVKFTLQSPVVVKPGRATRLSSSMPEAWKCPDGDNCYKFKTCDLSVLSETYPQLHFRFHRAFKGQYYVTARHGVGEGQECRAVGTRGTACPSQDRTS